MFSRQKFWFNDLEVAVSFCLVKLITHLESSTEIRGDIRFYFNLIESPNIYSKVCNQLFETIHVHQLSGTCDCCFTPTSKYLDVSSAMVFCHVCQKCEKICILLNRILFNPIIVYNSAKGYVETLIFVAVKRISNFVWHLLLIIRLYLIAACMYYMTHYSLFGNADVYNYWND